MTHNFLDIFFHVTFVLCWIAAAVATCWLLFTPPPN